MLPWHGCADRRPRRRLRRTQKATVNQMCRRHSEDAYLRQHHQLQRRHADQAPARSPMRKGDSGSAPTPQPPPTFPKTPKNLPSILKILLAPLRSYDVHATLHGHIIARAAILSQRLLRNVYFADPGSAVEDSAYKVWTIAYNSSSARNCEGRVSGPNPPDSSAP